MKIYVKNMACESCKIFVKEALDELGISPVKVELGEIDTQQDVSDDEKKKLNTQIKKAGMELLEKKQGVLIEKIKKFVTIHPPLLTEGVINYVCLNTFY